MYRLYLHCSQYIHTLYLVYFPFPFCLSFLPLRSSLLFLHLRFLPSCRIIPIVFPLKSYNPLSTRINLTSIEINKSYIFFYFYLDASSYNYVNISVNFFVPTNPNRDYFDWLAQSIFPSSTSSRSMRAKKLEYQKIDRWDVKKRGGSQGRNAERKKVVKREREKWWKARLGKIASNQLLDKGWNTEEKKWKEIKKKRNTDGERNEAR